MKHKENREKSKHRRVGIRWRLFAYLTLYTLLILLAVWMFQIKLLGYFYEKEKFSSLQNAAQSLSAYVGKADLESRANEVSINENACILLFEIENGKARPVINVSSRSDCVIHHLSPDAFSVLYEKAMDNGGIYDERVEFNSKEENQRNHFPGVNSSITVSAVYVQIVENNGVTYAMMLDAELTPMDTVTNTLKIQFSWIALSLLFATFLFAFLISYTVTKPLKAITGKAVKMAHGKYEANFEGRGYLEVEELSDALNFAAREISATDSLQKELIANISHDLRTPLTMIKGYGEVMRDIPGENNAENAQIIIDETARLSELVSDLLDLSKLQSGTKKPLLESFDLTELVKDTMKRYDALVHRNGYHIEFEPAEEALVCADRTMILQVIYNLINNAVNYTGDSLRVRVKEQIKEDCVRISVIDDGAGIPPEKIPEIWDRYYRASETHKRAVVGTGLGLSIVKSVLEVHHARYGVDSAVGVGSVFWFELPLQKREEPLA